MNNLKSCIEEIEKDKIIVIIRGLTKEQLIPTADALYKGGIRLCEITFDQTKKLSDEYTASLIELLNKEYNGKIRVGAGTVMTEAQVLAAKNAGAEYIISPNVKEAVIKKTKQLDMLSIPGAFTPTEAADAFDYGADYVKMFPAGELGVSYLKAIMAPLRHIPMLAVGGVNDKNLYEFLTCGLKGVGIGSNIVKKSYIENGEYEKITELAKIYTDIAAQVTMH